MSSVTKYEHARNYEKSLSRAGNGGPDGACLLRGKISGNIPHAGR